MGGFEIMGFWLRQPLWGFFGYFEVMAKVSDFGYGCCCWTVVIEIDNDLSIHAAKDSNLDTPVGVGIGPYVDSICNFESTCRIQKNTSLPQYGTKEAEVNSSRKLKQWVD